MTGTFCGCHGKKGTKNDEKTTRIIRVPFLFPFGLFFFVAVVLLDACRRDSKKIAIRLFCVVARRLAARLWQSFVSLLHELFLSNSKSTCGHFV